MVPFLYLAIQTLSMWVLVFVFYRLRKQFTLIPLYSLITISIFLAQHFANPHFELVLGSWHFVIGSISFFTTVMMGVLILYLLEGVRATRLAFWVIFMTTIFYEVLLFFISQELGNATWMPWSMEVVTLGAWSLLTLTLDVFFIAISWELLAKIVKLPLVVSVFLVIFGTFVLDSLIFVSAVFGYQDSYWPIMQSNLSVRFILALFATPLLSFYLEMEGFAEAKREKNTNFWEILNFRSDLENKLRSMQEVLKSEEALMSDLEKYKMAVEGASDHIVITDAEGRILFANKGVEKLTGYTNEEVLHKKAGELGLWGGLMPKKVYEDLWRTIKIEKKTFEGELVNHRKSGEKYVALSVISPILDKRGNVAFFLGIERDISREKEIDRMKTDFVSLVTHQLRTPISGVRWSLGILKDEGNLNDVQKVALKNAIDSNLHMEELVRVLLNISRIESGRIKIEPELADLKKLCEEVIKELCPLTEEKSIVVSVTSAYDQLINVDTGMIKEVYKNLLTNAIKYSESGSKISVRIAKVKEEVVVNVSDSGVGIPIGEQSRIFEKFYRASNVVKKVLEGTGLGLYLTKQIVEIAGGKIGFESEVGIGSTFWFSLPVSGMKFKEGSINFS